MTAEQAERIASALERIEISMRRLTDPEDSLCGNLALLNKYAVKLAEQAISLAVGQRHIAQGLGSINHTLEQIGKAFVMGDEADGNEIPTSLSLLESHWNQLLDRGSYEGGVLLDIRDALSVIATQMQPLKP